MDVVDCSLLFSGQDDQMRGHSDLEASKFHNPVISAFFSFLATFANLGTASGGKGHIYMIVN